MSYNDGIETTAEKLARMEREIRALQTIVAKAPSDEWRAVEIGSELRYLYVPSGTVGPAIGTK